MAKTATAHQRREAALDLLWLADWHVSTAEALIAESGDGQGVARRDLWQQVQRLAGREIGKWDAGVDGENVERLGAIGLTTHGGRS